MNFSTAILLTALIFTTPQVRSLNLNLEEDLNVRGVISEWLANPDTPARRQLGDLHPDWIVFEIQNSPRAVRLTAVHKVKPLVFLVDADRGDRDKAVTLLREQLFSSPR